MLLYIRSSIRAAALSAPPWPIVVAARPIEGRNEHVAKESYHRGHKAITYADDSLDKIGSVGEEIPLATALELHGPADLSTLSAAAGRSHSIAI